MENVSLEELMEFQDNLDIGAIDLENVQFTPVKEEFEPEESQEEAQPETQENQVERPEEDQQEEPEVIDLSEIERKQAQQSAEEEEKESSEQTPNEWQIIAERFQSEGIEVPEDFDWNNPEANEEYLSIVRKQFAQQAQESLLKSLPEEYRNAMRYALTTGKPLQDYVSLYNETDINLDGVDLEDSMHQEAVVRTYLRKTTSFSNERIDREVNKLKKLELLDEEAKSSFLDLKDIVEEEKKQLDQQLREAEKQREEKLQERKKLFHELVDSKDDIQETRKGKVKAFLTNLQWSKGQQPSTMFDRTIRKVFQKPEHVVQLADLLMDYSEEDGFNYERFVKKASTEATTKVKKEIDKHTKGKPQGRTAPPGNITKFDWKKWAEQN